MVVIEEEGDATKDEAPRPASGELGPEAGKPGSTAEATGPHEKAESCRALGNELLNKGDYADACQRYDEGLLALVMKKDDDVKRTSELRLALHLNAALAHLRRGNLASAVDHATGALAVDPKSVKALYRRGLARVQLADHPGHGNEVALARADFEEALRLEPGNADVRGHLQRLRATERKEQKELNKSQRESFKGIFEGGKPLYEDTPESNPAPVIHKHGGIEEHEALVSVEDLYFYYDSTEEVLQGVNLELRAGWCVGLFGNNAAGKTTLARLLIQKLRPTRGGIRHHGEIDESLPAASRGSWALSALAAAAVAAVAVLAALALDRGRGDRVLPQRLGSLLWAALLACFAAVMFVCKLVLDWRASRAKGIHTVLHVTSETNDKEDIPGKWTIERVIGEKLPRKWTAEKRRSKVIAMLCAGNFQMYNQSTGEPVGTPADYVRDGLQYGHLSGGQRHLIYVLRCFAANPRVLVCDELLGGLDAFRQPRVLHMLRRLKEAGTAVLYIGTELHQLRLACDSIGFLNKGRICELGPVEEVLDFPKHPATKDYIQQYRGLPGGRVIGGKLAENYTSIEGDEALAGPWLPM